MSKQQFVKRFLIWKYKRVSQRNFILLLSGIVGLIAGLISVLLKNLTFGISWLLEKSIIFSQNKIYFILPIIGLTLVYFFVKKISKKPLEPAIPSILFALSKKDGKIASNKIILPLITAPLTVGFGGSVGLLSSAIFSASAASSSLGKLLHINRKTRTLLKLKK
jgi:CIC family chloride channel protein